VETKLTKVADANHVVFPFAVHTSFFFAKVGQEMSARKPERDGPSAGLVIAIVVGIVLLAAVAVLAVGGGPLFTHTKHAVSATAIAVQPTVSRVPIP